MRTLGEVAQGPQTDHALTHGGHTPLGVAHATAYVHARDLTATATNCRVLRARDGHTPVQRRLRVCKEGSPASPSSHNRASYAAARRSPRCTCTGVRPHTTHLAPLPPGSARGGPPPPTRGQSPVGGLVALSRRHMDGSLVLWAGARGRRGAAPRHSLLRPAGRDLCG